MMRPVKKCLMELNPSNEAGSGDNLARYKKVSPCPPSSLSLPPSPLLLTTSPPASGRGGGRGPHHLVSAAVAECRGEN